MLSSTQGVFGWIIVAAAMLSGCGNSDYGDDAAARAAERFPPQSFSVEALTAGAIAVQVPAGEWRSLRIKDLPNSRLYVATIPETGAQPYFAVGNGPEGAALSFTAPPQDRPYATAVVGWFRGLVPGADSIVVFGSNAGTTDFFLGYAPPDFDLSSVGVIITGGTPTLTAEVSERLGRLIAARPAVPARFESGAGGYAGTVYRQRGFKGDLIEFSSGALSFMQSSAASAEPGVEVLREFRVVGETTQAGRGAARPASSR